MDEEPKEIKEPLRAAMLWLVLYIPVNIASLFLQYIPGGLTLILWGILLPVIFGFSTFFFLQQNSEEHPWMNGFEYLFLLAYGVLSFFSVKHVYGAWVAI